MLDMSTSLTKPLWANPRLRLVAFLVKMWFLNAFFAFYFSCACNANSLFCTTVGFHLWHNRGILGLIIFS